MTPVCFKGFPHFLREIARKVRLHLEGPKSSQIIATIGLADLYGPQSHGFFQANLTTTEERYKWAVDRIQGIVDDPRFRMFFAVHEVEAWLFSQPDIFPAEVRKNLPKALGGPESVDFQDPPSARLTRAFRAGLDRPYKKLVDGVELFTELDPETAAQHCPYLQTMLSEMLSIAEKAVGGQPRC